MSHKIAKAQRAAERNVATPNHMHTLIVNLNRQQRRTNAHKLKVVKYVHNRSAKSRLKGKVRKAGRVLCGEEKSRLSFDLEGGDNFTFTPVTE